MNELKLAKDVWYLMLDGTRKKMKYEQVISPDLSLFREFTPTDKAAWFTDGGYVDGNGPDFAMRDPNQFANYSPIPATVDTPSTLEVALLLRCTIDKATHVIHEGIIGGPGMDTEALVRYAYHINGKDQPDAEGLKWWVNEINTGKWRNFTDCLLGINAAFAAAKS